MEFDKDNVRQVVEEDRLSSLPDELLHKIMSSLDMKFVVQTCLLSSRWKLLWISMPCLNFSSWHFGSLTKFSKFMTHVLSHRNHQIAVSLVKLHFRGSVNQLFMRKIANYAFSHKVQQLNVTNSPLCRLANSPHFTFTSDFYKDINILRIPLYFPALTTLHLNVMGLCGDLFSKCANLKNLTLQRFFISGMEEVFDIITPRLSNLMLIDGRSSIAINVVAPQLESLTINDCYIKYLNAPPGLSSFCYRGYFAHHPPLFKDPFPSLEKVSIRLSKYIPIRGYEEEDARKIINMLQDLHSAKYLTLHWEVVECIFSFADLLSHHPSPFRNLICLTIIDSNTRKDAAYKVKMSAEVRKFWLEKSPSATLIMK